MRTPSPGTAQLAQPNSRSSTASAARAKRSRWNARSTTVATHQLVIGSFRSSNSPLAIGRLSRRTPAVRRWRRRTRAAKIDAARSTDSVDGARSVAPARAAIDVDTTPGIPHGSMRSKSPRSTVTFSAMPW